MNCIQLIRLSKAHINKKQDCPAIISPAHVFTNGARWMFDQLNELDPLHKRQFNNEIKYEQYGLMKYGICLTAFFISAVLFSRVNIFLTPLAIVVFYLFEIHFLFLFPLLIDNVKNPVWASIKQAYKTGIFSLLITIMPIGFFMMAGLFRIKNPLRNWYIGSLAVIIWYHHEVRDRPSASF